jgi:deoxyadenosine/deoxycytidine kinase
MGKLISVVGNIGAGKTTLVKLLCERGAFIPYWERPEERPFQAAFTEDMKKWALANQMDFLLFRAKQELITRQRNEIAIMDGGFDQDFYVFTRNLFNKGHLLQGEFDICEDFYHFARRFLPPPDLLIRIVINLPTLLKRRSSRVRKTVDESFDEQIFIDLERLLDEWLSNEKVTPVMQFTFNQGIQYYKSEIDELINQIDKLLFIPGSKGG